MKLPDTHRPYHDDLNRNVAGIRLGEDHFDDLAATPEEHLYAFALESRTREDSGDPVVEKPFLYGVAITWPLLRVPWHATRFSDGSRYGVWYGSLDLITTVHESVGHWVRFIRDSYPRLHDEVIAERHVFLVRCDADLLDLTQGSEVYAGLHSPRGNRRTRTIGRMAHARGEEGLLVPSTHQDAGVSAAIFRQAVLSRPRSRCHLRYCWNPATDTIRVELIPGATWLELRAEDPERRVAERPAGRVT